MRLDLFDRTRILSLFLLKRGCAVNGNAEQPDAKVKGAVGKDKQVLRKALSTQVPREWSIAMLGTVLIVILILLLVGALPTWPHSKSWGYYPSGGLGLILLILLILLLLGHI